MTQFTAAFTVCPQNSAMNCICDLCQGLDAKRAAARTWLGSRWLLAAPPVRYMAAAMPEPVEFDVPLKAVSLKQWYPPNLRLVKS